MDEWNRRLKKAREDQKMSLKDVTKKVNITQQSLIEYEKGNIYPKLDMLMFLCECYNVTLNYIVYGNNSGLLLENSMQKTIENIISLKIFDKIDIIDEKHIYIKDKTLSKYLYYFNEFLTNYSKEDLSNIETIIKAINNIK